jgi:hypothetical protein
MEKVRISVVGAGSLGSYATLLLASMGYEDIEVYDDDLVEYHNRRNQLFRTEDMEKLKVEVLAELVRFLTGVKIITHCFQAGKGTRFSGNVIIVLVHSMQARREIFEEIKNNPRYKLFIEARSGEHSARVYAINPSDPDAVKRYGSDEILYSDRKSLDTPCADETTQPTVWTVAATVAHFVRKWTEGWYPVCEETRIYFKEMPNVETEHLSI